MDDDKWQFMSFRNTCEPDECDTSAPPNVLASALESADVPFELVIYELSRDEAATDPETSDLYSDGATSGPERVFLYYFATGREHYQRACEVASRISAAGYDIAAASGRPSS